MAQFFLVAGVAADVFIGLVFLLAGIDKLRHRDLLPGVIANYRLLPAPLVAPVALLLPAVELVVGVSLMLGIGLPAEVAAAMLLLGFAVAMAINIGRGRRHIDCGCGHAGLRQSLGWHLVLRNAAMVSATAIAAASRLGDPAGLGVAEHAMGFVAGLVLFLLMLTFQALHALSGRQLDGARG